MHRVLLFIFISQYLLYAFPIDQIILCIVFFDYF